MSHISIGHLYTALHAACASAVARVVEANATDVSYVDLSKEERLDALENAEIDLLVSAWLPDEGNLILPGGEAIGSLYLPEPCFAIMAEAGNSAASLDLAAAITQCTRLIVTEDLAERAENARKNTQALAALPLEIIGEDTLISRVEQAAQAGENPLLATWQPHALFHTSLVQPVMDEENRLGQKLNAQLVLRPGVRSQIDQDLLDELSGMTLGNRVMNALAHAVLIEGIDPEMAAESWQRGRLLPR